jgi:hypothetical protein
MELEIQRGLQASKTSSMFDSRLNSRYFYRVVLLPDGRRKFTVWCGRGKMVERDIALQVGKLAFGEDPFSLAFMTRKYIPLFEVTELHPPFVPKKPEYPKGDFASGEQVQALAALRDWSDGVLTRWKYSKGSDSPWWFVSSHDFIMWLTKGKSMSREFWSLEGSFVDSKTASSILERVNTPLRRAKELVGYLQASYQVRLESLDKQKHLLESLGYSRLEKAPHPKPKKKTRVGGAG